MSGELATDREPDSAFNSIADESCRSRLVNCPIRGTELMAAQTSSLLRELPTGSYMPVWVLPVMVWNRRGGAERGIREFQFQLGRTFGLTTFLSVPGTKFVIAPRSRRRALGGILSDHCSRCEKTIQT